MSKYYKIKLSAKKEISEYLDKEFPGSEKHIHSDEPKFYCAESFGDDEYTIEFIVKIVPGGYKEIKYGEFIAKNSDLYYINYPQPVKDVFTVEKYLNSNVPFELFEKIKELKKKHFENKVKNNKLKRSLINLKQSLESKKDKIDENIQDKRVEQKLTKEIDEYIKETKKRSK